MNVLYVFIVIEPVIKQFKQTGPVVPSGLKWKSKVHSAKKGKDNSNLNSNQNVKSGLTLQYRNTIESFTNAILRSVSYHKQHDIVKQRREIYQQHEQMLQKEIMKLEKPDPQIDSDSQQPQSGLDPSNSVAKVSSPSTSVMLPAQNKKDKNVVVSSKVENSNENSNKDNSNENSNKDNLNENNNDKDISMESAKDKNSAEKPKVQHQKIKEKKQELKQVHQKQHTLYQDYENLQRDWKYKHQSAAITNNYLISKIAGWDVTDIECAYERRKMLRKDVGWNATDSEKYNVGRDKLIDYLILIAQDDTFGVFINPMLAKAWQDFFNQQDIDEEAPEPAKYNPSDTENMRLVVQQFLKNKAETGMSAWFDIWDKEQLKKISNNISGYEADEKKCENETSAMMLSAINLLNKYANMDDIIYRESRIWSLVWNSLMKPIIKFAMPKLWNKVIDMKKIQYDTILLQCMRKIWDKSCLNEYEQQNPNDPGKAMLEYGCTTIKTLITNAYATKSSTLKGDDNKPKWMGQIHFPALFGLEIVMVLVNHFQYRKYYTDNEFLNIGTPMNNKSQTKFMAYSAPTFTLWTKYLKLLCEKKQRKEVLEANSKIIIKDAIKSRFQQLQNSSDDSATMEDIIRFAYAQPPIVTSSWLQEKFENPLSNSLTCMYNYKLNWFLSQTWGKCGKPELAMGGEEIKVMACPTTFSIASLLVSKKIKMVYTSLPIADLEFAHLVYGNGAEYGFEMLFKDSYGYCMDGADVRHIDNYSRNCGGYPCIINNKFNADIAWAGIERNKDVFVNKPIALFWVNPAIQITKKVIRYLRKHGSKFDTCM